MLYPWELSILDGEYSLEGISGGTDWDVNTETLAATRTILTTDDLIQWFDPDGADRDINLPAEAVSTDLTFIIVNTANGAGEDLVIKDDTPTTISTLGPGMTGIFSCNGTSWKLENDTGMFFDVVNGYIGIGTNAPESPLHVVGSVFPVGKFERTTTEGHTTKGALGLKTTASENMVDGFGPSFSFFIEDTAGVENAIASISGVRDGADHIGAIILRPYTAGGPFNVLKAGSDRIVETFGGRKVNTTLVNVATYDLLITDHIINVVYTSTAAMTSLTLPTAQCEDGREIEVKDTGYNAGTNNITIDTQGAEKVNNADTLVINGDGDSVVIRSDGTNWHAY